VRRRSLRSFERRVGLFVTLVVAFVLALTGIQASRQLASHERYVESTARQARLLAEAVLDETGSQRLGEDLARWAAEGERPRLSGLSTLFLRERGLTSVELLGPDGWGVGTGLHLGAGASAEGGERLDERTLRRVAGGDVVVDVDGGLAAGPTYAVVTAHAPVTDRSGRFVGILEVSVAAGELAVERRRLRWSLSLQVGAVLAFALLLGGFMRWTLRPLHLLAAAAGADPDEDTADYEKQDDTGFVIETYRRMIDELKEKERELRRLRELERHRANELQDLNASIIDSMVSGVLVLDLSGSVRSMNEVAREVLGVGPGRAVGRPFGDVLNRVPELHARLQACLEDGLVIRRDELRLSLPGVGRRDVGLTLSPLVDREGSRTGALCLVVDLTEVKRLQEQVRAKESLAELGELSGGIAHEFRNSLATMLGYAKLVERQGSGEVVEHARDIVEEVGALRRVVDDFLRFANPTRLVLEPIDLAALVEDLRDDVAVRAAGREVALEIGEGLPRLTGDETLLRRAFTNLLRNAADAVGGAGRVRVSAELAQGEVTVHVDDDGPGVPSEDRERIFLPFVSGKDHGTGLGLALTRKIVVHHGGSIRAEESPLGGARFSVTLPLRGERDANSSSLTPASHRGNEK
jgi:PAS domain S-box-containing protein